MRLVHGWAPVRNVETNDLYYLSGHNKIRRVCTHMVNRVALSSSIALPNRRLYCYCSFTEKEGNMDELDGNLIRLVCFAAIAFNMGLIPKKDRTEEAKTAIDDAAFYLLGLVGTGE